MHFSKIQYERLYRELRALKKTLDVEPKRIRIYCNHDAEKEIKEIHEKKEKQHISLYRKFKVTIKVFKDSYWIHDRFAIMDQEIWHFGAAVGGMHGSLSALSRGWKDEGNALRDYFDGRC